MHFIHSFTPHRIYKYTSISQTSEQFKEGFLNFIQSSLAKVIEAIDSAFSQKDWRRVGLLI